MRWPSAKTRAEPGIKVLVTGSRGKSTIVRLLHTALVHAGFESHARITGVVPRHIMANGSRVILRSAGAHVEEMRWWLNRLPDSAQAVVLENSAITPELQNLAGQWLKPDVTVLSNTLADHQESWGPDQHHAAEVLVAGVPRAGRLVLPMGYRQDKRLMKLVSQRRCEAVFAEPASDIEPEYRAVNLGLAIETIRQLGLAEDGAIKAMSEMPGDRYDFDVLDFDGAHLAMAFSANDICSTRSLFKSLQWPESGTRLIYNHRSDRPARLKSFIDWLKRPGWREVMIIGDRPAGRLGSALYRRVRTSAELLQLFVPGDRLFGCGNISGIPVSLCDSGRKRHV